MPFYNVLSVKVFLTKSQLQILEHLYRQMRIVSCIIFKFNMLKYLLKGCHYYSFDDIHKNVTTVVKLLSKKCFHLLSLKSEELPTLRHLSISRFTGIHFGIICLTHDDTFSWFSLLRTNRL
jgi:hypothetical protein